MSVSGGILERMRNIGYRFCGVGANAGRIYFKSKNGSTQYLYLEFKSWGEVDEFCKSKECKSKEVVK